MTPAALSRLMEDTWPPAAVTRVGPWTIREGKGGGKRVSAASAAGAWDEGDLPAAEAAMEAIGQPQLFIIGAGEDALDQALAARGYRVVDPVLAYSGATTDLGAGPIAPLAAFAHWPPLAVARDLWAEGGIGPARLAVMDRVAGPKTAILGRSSDRAAGVAFVALAHGCAMLHALEVTPARRRAGVARDILRAAAAWAAAQGAGTLAVVVTEANGPARALYASLGMAVVGHYHYRQK